MSCQEYYRLDELEKRFNILPSTILYFVESSQVGLYTFIDNLKVMYGGYYKGKGFIGFGHGYYRGPVELRRSDQISILKRSKIRVVEFILVDGSNVINHSQEYAFTIELPNKYLHGWEPKDIPILAGKKLAGKIYPRQGMDSLKIITNALEYYKKSVNSQSSDANNLLTDNPQSLSAIGYLIELEDIVISHEALEKILTTNSAEIVPATEKSVNPKSRSDNASLRLVRNLIKLYPTKGASALWEYLRENHETDESLDPESILDEVGRGKIIWIDDKKNERSMSKKSFQNMVSKEK
jgi:hypothetical protein